MLAADFSLSSSEIVVGYLEFGASGLELGLELIAFVFCESDLSESVVVLGLERV